MKLYFEGLKVLGIRQFEVKRHLESQRQMGDDTIIVSSLTNLSNGYNR